MKRIDLIKEIDQLKHKVLKETEETAIWKGKFIDIESSLKNSVCIDTHRYNNLCENENKMYQLEASFKKIEAEKIELLEIIKDLTKANIILINK